MNWIQEAGELVKQKTGTYPVWKWMGRELKHLHEEGYSKEKILRHLEVFLDQQPTNKLIWPLFRQGFNGFSPEVHLRMKVDAQLDREHEQKLRENKRQPRSNDMEKLGEFLEEKRRRG